MADPNGFINLIEGMYDKDFSVDGRAILESRLTEFTDEVMNAAAKDIESANLNWRPKPLDVIGYCERARYRLKPKEEKVNSYGGDIDKLQFEMFKKLREIMFSGKVTRQQILDNIRKADETRRGTGWDKCGMALEKHYKDGGYDMDKPPSNQLGFDVG
jgi:hypothetical protein